MQKVRIPSFCSKEFVVENVNKSLQCEWDNQCLLMGVVPCVKPVAFQRDLPIVLITVVMEGGMCVCVCSSQPPLQTSPPSPPSLSLSHPLSCAHSLILSQAKNWQSSSSVRNSRPQVNPDGRGFVTQSRSLFSGVRRRHGDGSSGDL